MNHHEPSWTITNHHEPSWTIMNHHGVSWTRIPRICEFSIFHYSICLTNTIIMYMMVGLPHRRSTELIWRPPLITAFWRVKKRDYHFWCRSYSINTINIELAHAMLDLHHWCSNCCLYGIFSIPVSIHRCWNRWIRVIARVGLTNKQTNKRVC